MSVTKAAAKAGTGFRELHGVVLSAGLADRTVKVRVGGQKWNKVVKKYFNDPRTHLVHDPANSLRLGDVVAITPGWRSSQHKRHVVKYIIAPGSGVPIEDRPPVPTEEERCAARDAKYAAKKARRAARDLANTIEGSLSMSEQIIRQATKNAKLRAMMAETKAEDGEAKEETQQ